MLADVQKKNKSGQELTGTDRILERILKLALTDKDLKKTNDSILELEGEIDAIGDKSDTFKYSDLSKNLIEGLKAEREELIKKAGIMAKSKLELELGELKKLLAQRPAHPFETTDQGEGLPRGAAPRRRADRDRQEVQVLGGGRATTSSTGRTRASTGATSSGTYQYTLTKGCIDRDTANQQLSSSN